jgi:transposase
MIELTLPSFRQIKEEKESDHEIVFSVQLKERPSRCPHCDAVTKLYTMGQKVHRVMDVPQRGKQVSLLVLRTRYECLGCASHFWERLPDVDAKRKMTKRLCKYIQEEAQRCLVAATAEKVGICQGTIRQVCREAMTEEEYGDLMERGRNNRRRRSAENSTGYKNKSGIINKRVS